MCKNENVIDKSLWFWIHVERLLLRNPCRKKNKLNIFETLVWRKPLWGKPFENQNHTEIIVESLSGEILASEPVCATSVAHQPLLTGDLARNSSYFKTGSLQEISSCIIYMEICMKRTFENTSGIFLGGITCGNMFTSCARTLFLLSIFVVTRP